METRSQQRARAIRILDAVLYKNPEVQLEALKAGGISLELQSLGEKNVYDIFRNYVNPTSFDEDDQAFLKGILYLLSDPSNVLTAGNREFFRRVLNDRSQPHDTPLLSRATNLAAERLVGGTEIVRTLIDYGADVNTEWNGRTPLDLLADSANTGVYDYLQSQGGIHKLPTILFMKETTPIMFRKRYGGESLDRQAIIILGHGDKILIRDFFTNVPHAKEALWNEGVKVEFYNTLFETSSDTIKRLLLKYYNERMPFDTEFDYRSQDAMPKPMYSQKGYTCGSDAVFTILFECEEFAVFHTVDWSTFADEDSDICCIPIPDGSLLKHFKSSAFEHANLYDPHYEAPGAKEYGDAIAAAKLRFDRLSAISVANIGPGSHKRQRASITNDAWVRMIKPLNASCKPLGVGLYMSDIAIFFESVLTLNIFKLSLSTFGVVFFNSHKPPPLGTRIDNICAFVVLLKPIDERIGHYIGFFKNHDYWYCVDNEVGYLHKILDTEWFDRFFIPRLFNSLKDRSLDDVEKKVFFLRSPVMIYTSFLQWIFLTFGERSYPNLKPEADELTHDNLWMATDIVIIQKTDGATFTSAGAASKARRGGRRTRRTRRTRGKQRNTRRTRH